MKRFGLVCLLVLLTSCGQAYSAQDGATPSINRTSTVVASPTPLGVNASATTTQPVDTAAPTVQTATVDGADPTASSVLAVATPIEATHLIVVSAPLVIGAALRTGTLQVGSQSSTVEFASTPEQRQVGLMNRPALAQDAGMLFVFPDDQQRSFWMRNTLIPLSIAYIDAQFKILNIEDMQALDDQTFHLSQGPARYALEVNQGWFANNNIKPGDMVSVIIPADLEIQ